MTRTYSELMSLSDFYERFEYVKLFGKVSERTFGADRYLNQGFYRSKEWKRVRDFVITRDMGYDLACPDRPIGGLIIVHHMNPVSLEQIEHGDKSIIDPEFLISVSHYTHNAIHYGYDNQLPRTYVERKPFDTCPWKL